MPGRVGDGGELCRLSGGGGGHVRVPQPAHYLANSRAASLQVGCVHHGNIRGMVSRCALLLGLLLRCGGGLLHLQRLVILQAFEDGVCFGGDLQTVIVLAPRLSGYGSEHHLREVHAA